MSLKPKAQRALGSGSSIGSVEEVAALDVSSPPARFIHRPPTEEELQQWRDAIASQDSWMEAVPLLLQYYSRWRRRLR